MTTTQKPPTRPKSSFLKSVVSKLKPQRNPDSLAGEPPDILDSSRCHHTFADGRQCRLPAAHLCAQHSFEPKHGASRVSDASALEPLCADLTTATGINRALAQTYLLMAQGRISRKDAVAFGYLTQLLLQTVPGVRAEFVAAYGYQPWEERLKSALESNEADDDGGSDLDPCRENPGHPTDEIVEPKKDVPITPLFRHNEVQLAPVNKAHLTEKSIREGLTDADMESLDARTEDLFAGKYDVTPEGRREARVLEYEIELLKPARIKPAKGRVGQVASVVRRVLDAEKRDSAAATEPPSPLNYYGQPIKPGDWWHSLPGADKLSASLQSSPPEKEKAEPLPPAASAASDHSTGTAVPNEHAESSTCAPFAPPRQDDPLQRTGHTTDWHAPASWSGRPQPNPYPSRDEKLRRRFRSLSPAAFRRAQHHNSRGFWSPEIRNLAP